MTTHINRFPVRCHAKRLPLHRIAIYTGETPVQHPLSLARRHAKDELGSVRGPVVVGVLDDTDADSFSGDVVDVGLAGCELEGAGSGGGIGEVEEDVFLAVVFDNVVRGECCGGIGEEPSGCESEAAHFERVDGLKEVVIVLVVWLRL